MRGLTARNSLGCAPFMTMIRIDCRPLAARDRDQELREKKMNEERARRLEKSSRAYEKWREESKNKPKPATQGLLRTFIKI